MTRSSPGVLRVAAILNFMADHPGQSFVLTDLVRALKLSRATCHALLTGLVEVGYLYRTSDKSYVLGPALVAIGRTAAAHFSPLQVAQPEMRRLADDHGLICTAYFFEGDTLIVRERAASGSQAGYLGPVGTRLQVRPQTAAIFFAWERLKKVQAWVDSLEPAWSEEQREELDRGMSYAREHGFIPIVRASSPNGIREEAVLGTETTNVVVELADELDERQSYPLAALVAPVFDEHRKIAFGIGLAGFAAPVLGSEALKIAGQLTAACQRISRFIAGERTAEVVGEALAD